MSTAIDSAAGDSMVPSMGDGPIDLKRICQDLGIIWITPQVFKGTDEAPKDVAPIPWPCLIFTEFDQTINLLENLRVLTSKDATALKLNHLRMCMKHGCTETTNAFLFGKPPLEKWRLARVVYCGNERLERLTVENTLMKTGDLYGHKEAFDMAKKYQEVLLDRGVDEMEKEEEDPDFSLFGAAPEPEAPDAAAENNPKGDSKELDDVPMPDAEPVGGEKASSAAGVPSVVNVDSSKARDAQKETREAEPTVSAETNGHLSDSTTTSVDKQAGDENRNDNVKASKPQESKAIDNTPLKKKPSRSKARKEAPKKETEPKEDINAHQKRSASKASRPEKRKTSTANSSTKKKKVKTSKRRHSEPPELEDLIPTFADVRPILKKMGYAFGKNFYGKPGTAGDNVDNQSSFRTEQNFREHLCINGVVGNVDLLSEDEIEIVRKWVRYTIVSFPPGTHDLRDLEWEPISPVQVIRILKKFGIQMTSTEYRLPGVSKEDSIPGVNLFYSENGEHGLLTYLARYGWPDQCIFDDDSAEEKLAVELYLTDAKDVDTFVTNAPATPRSRRKARRSLGLTERSPDVMQSVPTPSASPGAATIVSRESTAAAMRVARVTSAKKTRSEVVMETPRPTRATGNRLSYSRATRESFAPATLPSTRTTPEPEKVIFIKQKIDASLKALSPSFSGARPAFLGVENSKFAASLTEVYGTLREMIGLEENNIDTEHQPTSLYVCGGPGIGKTSSVLWSCENVINQWNDASREGDDEMGYEPKLCYLNASTGLSSGGSTDSILKKFAKKIGKKVGFKNPGSNISLERIKSKLVRDGNLAVVVLDEIDSLLTGNSTDIDGPLKASERALSEIMKYANDEEFPMVVVGISNTTGTARYHRLAHVANFSKKITFTRYGEHELFHILESRLGKAFVSKQAMELIAKKVNAISGDARLALEITSDAIREFQKEKTEEELNEIPSGPVVTPKHVLMALRKHQVSHKDLINGLPLQSKVMLRVCVALAQEKIPSVTLKTLKEFTYQILKVNPNEVVDIHSLIILLEGLCDNGLLTLRGQEKLGPGETLSTRPMSDVHSIPISLNLPLEEIEKDLSGSLPFKEEVFEAVREEGRRNAEQLRAE